MISDRTIAALWVKKLRDMQSDGPEANMRIEYLKLLLFVMQRNKLTGIFEKAPPDGPLQGFPPNYKVTGRFIFFLYLITISEEKCNSLQIIIEDA